MLELRRVASVYGWEFIAKNSEISEDLIEEYIEEIPIHILYNEGKLSSSIKEKFSSWIDYLNKEALKYNSGLSIDWGNRVLYPTGFIVDWGNRVNELTANYKNENGE